MQERRDPEPAAAAEARPENEAEARLHAIRGRQGELAVGLRDAQLGGLVDAVETWMQEFMAGSASPGSHEHSGDAYGDYRDDFRAALEQCEDETLRREILNYGHFTNALVRASQTGGQETGPDGQSS